MVLDRTRSAGFEVEAIKFCEIEAFCRLTRSVLLPREVMLLREIDGLMFSVFKTMEKLPPKEAADKTAEVLRSLMRKKGS